MAVEIQNLGNNNPRTSVDIDTLGDLPPSSFFHQHIERDEKGFYYHLSGTKKLDNAPQELASDEKKWEALANAPSANGLPVAPLPNKNLRLVFWECKMKRISDIDTTKETFRCRFHYYLSWLATKSEYADYQNFLHRTRKTVKTKYWCPHWLPRLEFTNAVEVVHFEEHEPRYYVKNASNNAQLRDSWKKSDQRYIKLLGFDPTYGQWVRCRYEADIVFAEEMELENFPFDCQDFTAYFKAELETTTCRFLPFPRDRVFCSLDPQFSVLAEWELKRVMVEFKQTDRTRSRGTRTYSIIALHIKAARKWNTRAGEMLLTFCMMTMGLGAFSMSTRPNDLGNRLLFAITLMLADVTALQLLVQQLPNIPYWTEMDFYMYTCFFYLFLITLWSCFSGLAYERSASADYYAFIFFVILWLFANTMFLVRGFILYHQERANLNYTQKQLKKFYRDRRGGSERASIECKFSIDKIDEQEHDETLLFSGNKNKKGNITSELLSKENELLRLGTYLRYGPGHELEPSS